MLLSIIAITSSSAFAATVNVANGETSSQIQSKIDNAKSGDTLNFASKGTWKDITLTIDKKLNIVGNNGKITKSGNTTVFTFLPSKPGADSSGSSVSGFTINAPSAVSAQDTNKITIKNLTIASNRDNHAISLQRVNTAVVENVKISKSKYAISFNGGNGLTVSKCTISNSVDAVSMAQMAQHITLQNNTFNKNDWAVFFGGGVKHVTIKNNQIANSVYHGLSLTKSASTTTITGNTFKNNPIAVYLEQGNTAHGDPTVIGDISIYQNKITNSKIAGVYINTTATTLKNVAAQIKGVLSNDYKNCEVNIYPKSFTPKKDINLSHGNSIAASSIKRYKSTILTTKVKNAGFDNSNKIKVKITLPKGTKLASTNYKSNFNSKNKQWTVEVPAKKTISLSMKITGTTKGTKKILFNVNGKKQYKSVKVV
ncbi:MAG: right-handed parallel beta-helix repeat-containing protein [Methanobrevibacter sp.]|nr:right-handed parallel beta-helix repeat-containing protein [Methanobrevibacter sp.]